MFDITVDVVDGTLLIGATFRVHAKNVNPASTLSDISFALNDLLSDSGSELDSIVSLFGSAFNSSAELFSSITQLDKITLLLDANLNAEAKLVLKYLDPNQLISTNVDAIQLFTHINEVGLALIGEIKDAFEVTISGYGNLQVTPSVHLDLKVKNTATPFEVHQNPLSLEKYQTSGEFKGMITVAGENFPADVILQAYSPNLLHADSLGYVVGLDVDLVPMTESEFISGLCLLFPSIIIDLLFFSGIISVLDEIAALSYPTWLLDTVPYMPDLDLTCIATSGKGFLESHYFTYGTVSDFTNVIMSECSYDSLQLSGGYDITSQELKLNVVVKSKTGRSV